MLELFAATGRRCTRHNGAATVRVEIDLRPTAAYRASCDRRKHVAEEIPELTEPQLISRWLRADPPHQAERRFGLPVTTIITNR